MALRHYQQVAVDKGVAFLMAKPVGSKVRDKGVIVAPTAAGKSHMIAAIARQVGKVLILQPSKELLAQNFRKYVDGGGKAAIYSASFNERNVGEVTFATIGTIKAKGHLFRGYKLIIDECHLFPPKDTSMLGTFMQGSGIGKVLGLTATPFRLHKDELKFITRTSPKLFGCIVHCIQVSEMTSAGYWSKLLYKPVRFDDRLLKLNTAGTDYTEDSMKKAYEANDMAGTIVHSVRTMLDPPAPHVPRQSILVFVPTVAEAQDLAARIDGAVAVWGDMPKAARDLCIEDFKAGKIKVVVNVNVLSVGFDHPGIDGIVVARPTLSLAWYYQAVGRGTRIDPTKRKTDCWVYDLAGTFDRFGRVENITVKEVKDFGWAVLGTAQQRLFTNLPLTCSDLFTEENIKMVDLWKQAMLNGWGWPPDNRKKYGQKALFAGY
jgi:DNA repair protein RadD